MIDRAVDPQALNRIMYKCYDHSHNIVYILGLVWMLEICDYFVC